MKVLVTGGAGFIGRWVVRSLLKQGHKVWVLDNLSNGDKNNLFEFENDINYQGLIIGDILNKGLLNDLFERKKFEICIHSAAQINVQKSLDDPQRDFEVNVIGTHNILESCRLKRCKLVLLGTCMVYDMANAERPINELWPLKPSSPYAGSKLSAEFLALSYFFGYNLPVVILRPFNTFGPFQKSNMEGGAVSIFVKNSLEGRDLNIFGDGTQTRDLLYVEDCAEFIVEAAFNDKAIGEVINAGTGTDIMIRDLAKLICPDENRIKFVKHHHPQSEIYRLCCDFSKAKKLLRWEPTTSLIEGVEKLKKWLIDKSD